MENLARHLHVWRDRRERRGAHLEHILRLVECDKNHIPQSDQILWHLFADYYVYDIENAQEVAAAKIQDFPQTQYAIWSPTGHILTWVSNDKNIYYITLSKN